MGPEDAARTPQKRLKDMRDGLLRLHKTLLDSERAVYDRDVERIRTPNQLLALVLHDPWFAWLHELSAMVVQIDEMLDADEAVSVTDAERMLRMARELVSPAEEGRGFRRRYFEAMQRDPNVIFAHREVTQLLALLG